MSTNYSRANGLGIAAMLLLAGCTSNSAPTPSTSATPASSGSVPIASPSPSAASVTPVATIAEIQNQPVFVRLLSAAQEIAAKKGMGLQTGETIRTQGQALAQVDLKSGLAFRIGGDSVLTLQPDNRLNLTSGDMITWVQPGKKVPTEIVTPVAVAGIRGTTVFVKIPQDPKQETLFFAWEGTVAVRLPGQTEEVILKTADEVKIKPGERDIAAVRRRVRRLPRAEWRQKRQRDRLLRSFTSPMSTLRLIEQLKPGQTTLSQVIPSVEQGKPRQTALNISIPQRDVIKWIDRGKLESEKETKRLQKKAKAEHKRLKQKAEADRKRLKRTETDRKRSKQDEDSDSRATKRERHPERLVRHLEPRSQNREERKQRKQKSDDAD